MNMREFRPNLFIIGVPKGGTTSLYEYLRSHPKIHMSPIKEPNFFTNMYQLSLFFPEIDKKIYINSEKDLKKRIRENPHFAIIKNEKLYLNLFVSNNSNNVIYRGEATVNYIYYADLERILNYSPDSKFILILRNPIERAWSDFLMGINTGIINVDYKEVNNIITFFNICKQHRYILQHGFYSSYLNRYSYLIEKEYMKIILYDELKINMDKVLLEILKFLNLPEHKLTTKEVFNVTRIPRYSWLINLYKVYKNLKIFKKLIPDRLKIFIKNYIYTRKYQIPFELREELKQLYKEDIENTAEILKLDLKKWLI